MFVVKDMNTKQYAYCITRNGVGRWSFTPRIELAKHFNTRDEAYEARDSVLSTGEFFLQIEEVTA